MLARIILRYLWRSMIVKISWRNLWRNRRRSLITLGAIVAGLWGIIMIYGANNGMMVGMVEMAILAHTSHVQVHAKGYHQDPEIKLTIDDPEQVLARVEQAAHVAAAAPRVKVRAMLSTSRGSSGVQLVGIDPEKERKVTNIDESMVKGHYFSAGHQEGILVGAGLAEKLKTREGKKIVVYVRDVNMDLHPMGVRVAGTFDTGTASVDKFMAFVPMGFLQSELGLGTRVHEVAVRVDERKSLEAAKQGITASLAAHEGLEVLTWKEMFAFLVQLLDLAAIGNYVMLVVVSIAMSLGIANTMVMSVYERFRELGIMKAIGASPARVFIMIVIESILLAITGLMLGTLAGWVSIEVWDVYGLDLSTFSRSLKSVGMPSIIYPEVYAYNWVSTWVVVLAMAVGASFYPAIKAARQSPAEAMRM